MSIFGKIGLGEIADAGAQVKAFIQAADAKMNAQTEAIRQLGEAFVRLHKVCVAQGQLLELMAKNMGVFDERGKPDPNHPATGQPGLSAAPAGGATFDPPAIEGLVPFVPGPDGAGNLGGGDASELADHGTGNGAGDALAAD